MALAVDIKDLLTWPKYQNAPPVITKEDHSYALLAVNIATKCVIGAVHQ